MAERDIDRCPDCQGTGSLPIPGDDGYPRRCYHHNAPTDITTQLRAHLHKQPHTHWDGCITNHPLCALAWTLDEIERLRAELITTRAERDHNEIQANHLAARLIKETSHNKPTTNHTQRTPTPQ